MNKQIIIDGVDVSGCEHYGMIINEYKQITNWCNVHQGTCEENPNCYYKNWQRKEQECEELNKWLPIVTRLEEQFKSHEKAKSIGYKTYAEQVFTELDQLKAENEELRQLLSKEPLALQALQSGYADYKKRSEVFFEMINQYKQALTEIKEIAEHCIKQDICTTCDNSDKCHIEDEEIPTYDVCKLFLQKISEVLDE